MTTYKFPNIEEDIINATTQRDILNKEIDTNNDINTTDIKAYNKKLNTLFSNIMERQNLDKKIAQLKAESRIPDPNKLTLNQFIDGLTLDFYDMYDELIIMNDPSIVEISKIINKNYRKLTILMIFLIIFLLIFYILSIKSYLFTDERKT